MFIFLPHDLPPYSSRENSICHPSPQRDQRGVKWTCIYFIAINVTTTISTARNARTQGEIQTHSMAAVNCTQRRPLTIAKCIAWHVHSGEPNMPNRERWGGDLKFHHNTFKSTFQSLPDVQIQFRNKFSLSTFQDEFKFHSFEAMQG